MNAKIKFNQSSKLDPKSSPVDLSGTQLDSPLSKALGYPISYQMKLKEQLCSYLKLRGMTAAELARRSGVKKQSLSLWLGGSTPKKIDEVKKVADVLGVSVDQLCFGTGTEPTQQNTTSLDALLGDGWLSGLFEIRLRRVKQNKGSESK